MGQVQGVCVTASDKQFVFRVVLIRFFDAHQKVYVWGAGI